MIKYRRKLNIPCNLAIRNVQYLSLSYTRGNDWKERFFSFTSCYLY